MFIQRRVLPDGQKVELWECEWENLGGMRARKVFVRKIGEEQPVPLMNAPVSEKRAICWSYGRTLDNIAVLSPALVGHFQESSGKDATLPCEFVNAGKYRNGAERWWCRTHQTHWGAKADQASYANSKAMVCANHTQRMHYVVGPIETELEKYAEAEIHCALPPALSTRSLEEAPPRIHVVLRRTVGARATIDREVDAMSLHHRSTIDLFSNSEITRLNVTPPAAFEFMCGLEYGRDLSCVACSSCAFPHLDLGDFARKPHRKHFCANCGRDSTWSKTAIVSTPLKPLYDHLVKNHGAEVSKDALDLDEFRGCDYSVWASTPAIIWTPNRAQTVGIHVRVWQGRKHIVSGTFGEVKLRRKKLDRRELFEAMIARTTI